MREDVEHLRLLAIFHFVVAGVAALFACFPLIHLCIGIAIVTGAFPGGNGGNAMPPFVGWFFILFASFAITIGWAFAICLTFAGRSLQQHRRRIFCIVVAALACTFFPFGTVLGVLTIIVLCRPSVKDLFEDFGRGRHADESFRA